MQLFADGRIRKGGRLIKQIILKEKGLSIGRPFFNSVESYFARKANMFQVNGNYASIKINKPNFLRWHSTCNPHIKQTFVL
jgi:hypothetical protein